MHYLMWIIIIVSIILVYFYFFHGKKYCEINSTITGLRPLIGSLKDSKKYLPNVLGAYVYDDIVSNLNKAVDVADGVTNYLAKGERKSPRIPKEWDFSHINGENKRENITRYILETIFNKPFESIRPEWLVNPSTGNRLEIDCYNEELNLGVEISGSQHYREEDYFHKGDRDKFLKQVYRDRVKKEMILEKGINLIIVPYTIPINQIPNYLIEKLKILNLI